MRSPWVTSIIFHSASALLTLVTPGDTGLSDILHGYPVTLAIMGFIVALCKTLSCNPPHTSSRECTITQLTLPSPRHARDFHPLDYGAATRTKQARRLLLAFCLLFFLFIHFYINFIDFLLNHRQEIFSPLLRRRRERNQKTFVAFHMQRFANNL
mgnify:CR=1 FL=1